MYIHELKGWPRLTWDQAALASPLARLRLAQGRLLGRMGSQAAPLGAEASLQALTQDVLRSNEIEGQRLDGASVRSSLARRLGLPDPRPGARSAEAEGAAALLFDATHGYAKAMSKERLLRWQAGLFPARRGALHRVLTGSWRNASSGPMQVVSGPAGRQKVHFEAPSWRRLPSEMARFLRWFNAPLAPGEDLVLRAGLAHFWFVTLHPFEDGNGRLARALAELLLARSEQSEKRYYSVSAQILKDKGAYYDVLERCQRGGPDIGEWMHWHLACVERAILAAEGTLSNVLRQGRFWQASRAASLNPRQRKMLELLLNDFQGKLTSSKWAKICRCSQDSALRDIQALIELKILRPDGQGGRSTSYSLES